MKKLFLVTLISLALLGGVASAGVEISGTELTATYTEPLANEDYCQHPTNYRGLDTQLLCEANGGTWITGQVLSDLDYTLIYYDVGNGTGEQVTLNIPATSPSGGGNIIHKFLVPIWSPIFTIKVSASAVDTSGNESARTSELVITMDKLKPKNPRF